MGSLLEDEDCDDVDDNDSVPEEMFAYSELEPRVDDGIADNMSGTVMPGTVDNTPDSTTPSFSNILGIHVTHSHTYTFMYIVQLATHIFIFTR